MTEVMGVPVRITALSDLMVAIERAIATREPCMFVGLYPALSLHLKADPRYREVLEKAQLYPDGMGVVWAMKIRGCRVPERMATTDIVWSILALAEARGWRVGLYGGASDVAEKASKVISSRHPRLHIVTVADGFREIGEEWLKRARPDLLLVGRGAPLQELWSDSVAIPAGVPAVLTCGGLFDFIAGRANRAPMWMRRRGFEWIYRVLQEPRRLGRRYFLGNPLFILWEAKSFLRCYSSDRSAITRAGTPPTIE